MYIGNKEEKAKTIKWLNEYFHSKTNKTKDYCVLYGEPGNGKTFLVYHLATKFKVEVHRITADEVTSKKELNDKLKCLNICSLDGQHTKKVILIDDLEDFKFKANICKITDICNYPIFYTSLEYPPDTLRSGLTLEIKKPSTPDLFKLLKLKQKEMKTGITLKDEKILQIAKESPSVRSAINSLYTGIVNKSMNPNTNLYKLKKQIKQRDLQEDLISSKHREIFNTLSKRLNCYTPKTYKIIDSFATYDFLFKGHYYSTIDKFLINNTSIQIEDISWFKFEKKKPKKNQKEPQQPKKKEIKLQPSIDSWF